jgi:phosphate transport system substrate-binding protein
MRTRPLHPVKTLIRLQPPGERRQGTINIYASNDRSGIYDTFKSIILGADTSFIAIARQYESNDDLSEDVSRDPAGIGFTGLPYVRNSKALAVSEEGARPIYPNFFTFDTKDYPISRRLYMSPLRSRKIRM